MDMRVLSPSSGWQAPRSHSEGNTDASKLQTHTRSFCPGNPARAHPCPRNSTLLAPTAPGWQAPFKREVHILDLPQLLLHELLGPDLCLQG